MDRLKELSTILSREELHYNVTTYNDTLVIEEEWFDNGCKNDDDCIDYGYEISSAIIERFPELELVEVECHRHKYAIVVLKLNR